MEGLTVLQCGGCVEEMVFNKEDMVEHMVAIHPRGEPLWCDQCNYTFLTEEEISKHNGKYHASQGTKKRRYLSVKIKEEVGLLS